MNHKNRMFLAVTVAIGAIASTATLAAPLNGPPPPGAILDLGGGETGTAALPVNVVVGSNPSDVLPGAMPTLERVDFTASSISTVIALAMRDDPAGLIVWNVAVTDLTHPGTSPLLNNGNFASGLSSWTLLNPNNTSSVINAFTGCGPFAGLSNTCIAAGNDSAYDTIDQKIGTKVGDVYQLSFYYGGSSGNDAYFNDVSTNGKHGGAGNAIDILAYATPVPGPEIDPASAMSALTLLAGGLTVFRGRKQAG
jgi:hypothetical protein